MSEYSDNGSYLPDDEEEYDFEEEYEIQEEENNKNELEEDKDDEELIIDTKFNNRTKFENINKILQLSNSSYQNNEVYQHKISSPVLTKYELTKVIGVRMEQIASGMKPFISINDKKNTDIYQIVLQELREKKVPFIIKRNLPNGNFEYWKLEDLEYNV